MPTVIMEAHASGLPSIVYDVPGCNEIIENNHNGIICKFKDINCLASSVEQLYLNKNLYVKITKEGSLSSIKYNEQTIVDKKISLYESKV